MSKKSLTETHPEVAKQWHPTKNSGFSFNDENLKKYIKYWWKCDVADDHEWQSNLSNRLLGKGCPICVGQKIVLSNCLATINPELSKQWHPTKNGDLTPYDVSNGSAKKVWWKCDKGDDHEWETQINSRARGNGCPICLNKKIVLSNCLATTNPELAKQWHPTKNGNLTTYDVTNGTVKKVWWKCDKGDDHEWETQINRRASRGSGCLICSNKKVVKSNCLATTDPELSKQWHPTKNGDLTPYDVTSGSHNKIWWKCDKEDDHEWETRINHRVSGSNCSICNGKKVVVSNCLAITNPELAKQWHPTKNGILTPYNITSGSNTKIWWKCEKGDDHEWKTVVYNRKVGGNCPICINQKTVLSNSLISTDPELAKQWHPTKNGTLSTSDLVAGSGKKVWWKCNKGVDHEWKTSAVKRLNGSNCPFCTLTPQSKQELTITFELIKIFEKIDPKGLKTNMNGRLRSIDIFIPKLNLCIEFDGSYWHKDNRELDKIKSEMLFEEGFKLIRVREEPLKKLYDTDVISKVPYNGKQVTNDVLSMIMEIYDLNDKLVSKIKEYQVKDELQNEKGLDRYIDKILTEKAEKKANK